jgi:hypothetical protein
MILAISSGWFAFWLLVVFIISLVLGLKIAYDYYENRPKK